jgi:hypothetical protein
MTTNLDDDMAHDFTVAARAATGDLPFDPERTLAGVLRRRRRRRVRRISARLAPVAVAAVVLPVLLTAGHTDQGVPAPPNRASAPVTPAKGRPLAPYVFAAMALPASPAAEVDGVVFGRLPDDMTLGPVLRNNTVAPPTVKAKFTAGGKDRGITVIIARKRGLTVDRYLKTNWFDGTPTTVSGRPALANSISGDDAAGLLWSPADGIVIEAHAGRDDAGRLRELVGNMHLKTP